MEKMDEITNPLYLLYAKAHGMLAIEILARDKEEYPGGCMAPYMLWVDEMIREHIREHPANALGKHVNNMAYFLDWVEERIPPFDSSTTEDAQ